MEFKDKSGNLVDVDKPLDHSLPEDIDFIKKEIERLKSWFKKALEDGVDYVNLDEQVLLYDLLIGENFGSKLVFYLVDYETESLVYESDMDTSPIHYEMWWNVITKEDVAFISEAMRKENIEIKKS